MGSRFICLAIVGVLLPTAAFAEAAPDADHEAQVQYGRGEASGRSDAAHRAPERVFATPTTSRPELAFRAGYGRGYDELLLDQRAASYRAMSRWGIAILVVGAISAAIGAVAIYNDYVWNHTAGNDYCDWLCTINDYTLVLAPSFAVVEIVTGAALWIDGVARQRQIERERKRLQPNPWSPTSMRIAPAFDAHGASHTWSLIAEGRF